MSVIGEQKSDGPSSQIQPGMIYTALIMEKSTIENTI
jgi:hypothetical protein